jgi:hypothetical protein
VSDEATECARAQAVIRRVCIKSAATGAGSGAVTTASTMYLAESGPIGLLALPVAGLAIGSEMVYRAMLHIELACDLADIFGVAIDPDDPQALWHILTLALKEPEVAESDDEDEAGLVRHVAGIETHEAGESIGNKLLGESVLRNVVPFLGIVASAVTNWKLARRLGDTLRRYFRYRRALHDALAQDESLLVEHRLPLIQGFWLIFSSDGKVTHEEAAILGRYLDKTEGKEKDELQARFAEEPEAWLARLDQIPVPQRGPFLHALCVAATLDKVVSREEEELLREAAKALELPFDLHKVEKMIDGFQKTGVLAPEAHVVAAVAEGRKPNSSSKRRS